jgi:hypothetical protein
MMPQNAQEDKALNSTRNLFALTFIHDQVLDNGHAKPPICYSLIAIRTSYHPSPLVALLPTWISWPHSR